MAEENDKAAATPPAAENAQSGDAMAVDSTTKPTETANDASDPISNTDGDVKMADGDSDGATKPAETEANGVTSASEKKGDKSRRKSAGVPEHRSKKLNKKKSKAEFHTDAKPGELFLARMKGHPPWPSIIADEDMLPETVSKKRPVTAPNADGSWRRPEYAPEGKRHNERTFAIMFLHTNEFAWIPNDCLTNLTPEECKDVSEKSKSKALIAAFQEASEGHDLQHYKGLLDDHQNALIEEQQARAEREAEKVRKAEKKARRKSGVDDEMDVDENGETKSKSKKRKKEAGDDDEKPSKTPKTPKLKLSNPKTPGTNEKSAKKKEASAKASKKKSKAISSDDDDAPEEHEAPMTAQEKHEKLRENIRYCRHKLQRSLLSRDSVPTDEEVGLCEPYLKKLEENPDLAVDIITSTKIHKVLKAIIKLPSIPKEEEYAFKKRSSELLAKWSKILAETQQPAEGKEREKKEASTNGEAKPEAKSEDKSEEKNEDKAEKKPSEEPGKDKQEKDDGDSKPEVKSPAENANAKPAEPESKAADAEASKPAESAEAEA